MRPLRVPCMTVDLPAVHLRCPTAPPLLSPLQEILMSKGQRGNKEAKKPKKLPAKPSTPPGTLPGLPAPSRGPRPR